MLIGKYRHSSLSKCGVCVLQKGVLQQPYGKVLLEELARIQLLDKAFLLWGQTIEPFSLLHEILYRRVPTVSSPRQRGGSRMSNQQYMPGIRILPDEPVRAIECTQEFDNIVVSEAMMPNASGIIASLIPAYECSAEQTVDIRADLLR
jgi:hypothetical protein